MMAPVTPGTFEPAPLWAIFWAVVVGFGGLLALLSRIRTILAAIRDGGFRIEQWAAGAEERARLDLLGRGGVRRAARVDGWLDPAAGCPPARRPGGPPDGVVVRGRVTNRAESPVWDVLVEVVDPLTGQVLPLVPLTRHVLPPGEQWSLEWFAGCAVTGVDPDPARDERVAGEAEPETGGLVIDLTDAAEGPSLVEGRSDGRRPLPVPDVLVEAGTVRPQLRITFSDTTGRWARQGAWVAPVTRHRHLPPGCAALSRAAEEFRDADAQSRPPDTARIAIEVSLAVHEVARNRLGRFSDSPLDLSALPRLLTLHPVAGRLRFEPGVSSPAAGAVSALATAVRLLDERIGSASGSSPEASRLLLAHAGSVLTALNALRLGTAGTSPGTAGTSPGTAGTSPGTAGTGARTASRD
jgi:hypothetical protein